MNQHWVHPVLRSVVNHEALMRRPQWKKLNQKQPICHKVACSLRCDLLPFGQSNSWDSDDNPDSEPSTQRPLTATLAVITGKTCRQPLTQKSSHARCTNQSFSWRCRPHCWSKQHRPFFKIPLHHITHRCKIVCITDAEQDKTRTHPLHVACRKLTASNHPWSTTWVTPRGRELTQKIPHSLAFEWLWLTLCPFC